MVKQFFDINNSVIMLFKTIYFFLPEVYIHV